MELFSSKLLLNPKEKLIWTVPKKIINNSSWSTVFYNPFPDYEYGFAAISNVGKYASARNGEIWEVNEDAIPSYNWQSATLGKNSQYIDIQAVIGYGGYIASNSAISGSQGWATSASYVSNLGNKNWVAIQYGYQSFIALGNGGYVSTNYRGQGWTNASYVSNLGDHDWQALAFGNGTLIALGAKGYISTSTDDGLTWTVASQIANLGSNSWAWKSATFGNGIFVAISGEGFYSYSTDFGVTWTNAVQDKNLKKLDYNYWASITFGNNKFLAISDTGYVSSTI